MTTLTSRAIAEASYCVKYNATVREIAKEFGISKSTVFFDLTKRIPHNFEFLSKQVRDVLDNNKEERHYRGGKATKEKYLKIKKQAKEE